jgi:hypothetical protein
MLNRLSQQCLHVIVIAAVINRVSFPAMSDEAQGAKVGQLMGNGRWSQSQLFSDPTDGAFFDRQQMQNLQSGWVGQCLERLRGRLDDMRVQWWQRFDLVHVVSSLHFLLFDHIFKYNFIRSLQVTAITTA